MPSTDPIPRPPSNRAQIASAICSMLTVCIASAGLIGLKFQVEFYQKNEQRESDRRVRDAFGKLYPMDIDIWKTISQHPKLKNAILADKDGSVLSTMSQDERARFDATCQMIGDMYEYYLLIESDLKGH